MNYGLYLSASGVLTNLYRQDVFANNLANAQTAGFKRDLASLMQRSPEVTEDELGMDLRSDLLDKLGGGALAGPQRIGFDQGPLRTTDRPLDIALEGEGFFTVALRNPSTGRSEIRLTRDGSFSLNTQGTLVTASGGRPVLDDRDQPIQLRTDVPVQVSQTGDIVQGDEIVARLGIAMVDRTRLTKQGENLFAWTGSDPRTSRQTPPQTLVRQGFSEMSNVDPVRALLDVVNATKAVSSNGNLIRYHDLLMDRAVNTLGRVA